MKVRCTQIAFPRPGRPDLVVDEDPRFSVGSEYVVLAIEAARTLGVRFLIINDQGQHGMVPAEMFEVVSARIPTAWRVAVSGGELNICPEAWLEPGFWEQRYAPGRNRANEIYDAEIAKMIGDETQ